MKLALQPDLIKLIEAKVAAGKFATPEEVVSAALQALDQDEEFGEFALGELSEFLTEGERSIELEGTLDGDAALRERGKRRRARSS